MASRFWRHYTRWVLGRLALGMWLTVVAGLLGGCIMSKDCTAAGCSDGATFSGEIKDTPGPLLLEFCVNGYCSKDPGNPAVVDKCTFFSGYAAYVVLCVREKTATGSRRVDGGFDLLNAEPTDGDQYTLKLTDVHSDAVVGTADKQVQYAPSYPNGHSCPAGCKRGELHVAPP